MNNGSDYDFIIIGSGAGNYWYGGKNDFARPLIVSFPKLPRQIEA